MRSLPPHFFIDSSDKWHDCLDQLNQVGRFAIDLESNSLYAYRERICLIQISTEEADFIVDPLADIDLAPLGKLIESPHVEKVLHAAEYDLILMHREHGWRMHNLFDTMWGARILGYEKIGLASMLGELYGLSLDKKHQRANWCERPLTTEQLAYAQTDTHFLLRLRDDMYEMLAERDGLAEAAEIFDEQADVRIPDTSFNPEGFWSMNGTQSLERDELAILRELYIVRDAHAEKRNRPPFKILNNSVLIMVAEQKCKSMADLEQVHGLSTRQIERYGKDVLKAVERGKRAPFPRPPRRPRPPDDQLERYDLLKQWRKERAIARGVASDVVMSREQLNELAKKNPQSVEALADIKSLGDWRRESYGADVVAVLQQ